MKKKNKIKFFTHFWNAFWRPEMLILPGQIAFFLFLSVVPTLTLISYACSYLNLSNDLFQNLFTHFLGKDIAALVTPIITSTQITPSFFISLGVGYFIASNGMASIIVASNTIYGIKDSGFFRRRLKAIVMELVIVILFIFILLVPLLGDNIIDGLHFLNINAKTELFITNLLNIFNGPMSWVIIFFFIEVLYIMAPDCEIAFKNVHGGAFFTTIAWVLATSVYSYYVSHFANYSVFYGGLANIIILMLWVYILSYTFVIGLAMNYHESLEKTGVIEISNLIKESANNAPVYDNQSISEIQSKNREIKKLVKKNTKK